MVVQQAIRMHQAVGRKPGLAEDVLAGKPLVAQVVEGEADPGVRHAQPLVNLEEQHGRQGGLPVMAVTIELISYCSGCRRILVRRLSGARWRMSLIWRCAPYIVRSSSTPA